MAFLTVNSLSKALTPYYEGVPPSPRVIKRAIERGMPFILDPLYGKPRFVLEDVLAWIQANRTSQQDKAEVNGRGAAWDKGF